MNKVFIAIGALFLSCTVKAGVVAYWETNVNAPDWYLTNAVSATSFKTGVVNDATNWGSNDGSYGTVDGADVVADGGFKGAAGTHMSTRITNVSGSQLRLDSLHFDYARNFSGSADSIIVALAGGNLSDTNGTVIAFEQNSAQIGARGNYNDVDVTLSSVLSDVVLDDGEFVTFRYTFAGGTGNGGLDNIAVQATVIPEPATLGLMASFGAGVLFIRRSMRL